MVFTLFLALFVALPALAFQQRPGSSSSGSQNRQTGRGSTATGSRTSTAATASRPASSVSNSAGGSYVNRSSGRYYPSSSFGGGRTYNNRSVPEIKNTSFYSYVHYYSFQDYLYRLRMRYFLNSAYFGRFYRNREPLLTPRMQQLTLRDSLVLSTYMLAAVDELEQMILDVQAGKPVNRDDIRDKTKEIRAFAKKIRKDDLLDFLDQRKNRDITKGKNYDQLGLDAVKQLRGVALDLNTQLRNMYGQATTSTISVSSLAQPSFESMSKGIDKLCKIIDKSAKRL
jgi:hypothetical protein